MTRIDPHDADASHLTHSPTGREAADRPARPIRPDPFIAGKGGPKISHTTLTAAGAVVAAWRPEDRFDLSPLAPGWAGLQPYRAEDAAGNPFFLKVQSVDHAVSRPNAGQRAAVAAEAERARWAGERGLGPRVLFSHPPRAAYVTEWLEGPPMTDVEVAGPLAPAFIDQMASLHAQDPHDLPSQGDVHWLHAQRPAKLLADAQGGLSRPQVQTLLALEQAIDDLLGRTTSREVPIHDDLHRGNAIRHGSSVVLVDWNNLKLGDPLTDVGHFAAFADVPNSQQGALLSRWSRGGNDLGSHSMISDAERLALRVAYFDLRNLAFFNQWPGTLSNYLRYRVADDLATLAPTAARELGANFSDGKSTLTR